MKVMINFKLFFAFFEVNDFIRNKLSSDQNYMKVMINFKLFFYFI
jgi:hypothetical protein